MFVVALPLLCLRIAAPAAAQQDAAELRPKWIAGQTAVYEFWFQRKDEVTMSFGGNTRQSQSLLTTEGHTRWVVGKVNDDGSAQCTMTIEWCTATAEAEGVKQVNDSRKASGDNEMMQKLLAAVTQTPLKVKVNADGSIESVDGVDAMRRKIGKDFEELVPEALDFVESASELATVPYAPASLAPGAAFDAEYRWTHDMGHVDEAWDYKLEAVETLEGVPVATITGRGTITLDVDESELPKDGPPINVKMTRGEASSQVFYDLDRREAVGRHTTASEVIHITVTLPEGRGKIERTIDRTSQSQALRIETGSRTGG